MTTGLFTHCTCSSHITPPGHPERVARLDAVSSHLSGPAFTRLVRKEATPAQRRSLALAHTERHIDSILGSEIPEGRFARIDADTAMSRGSSEAAVLAAGAVIAAVDAVMTGELQNAFCAVRPPGHHAERDRAMGFCLFNNIAVGALHARAAHGLSRIAVVDFDVHHGNGTQDIFFDDPALLYASTHQWPLYPGTGAASEQGVAGNILNVPLPPGAGGKEFRAGFANVILPAVDQFKPDFILLSAGFDAHRADPLAQLALEENDFAWATQEICRVAKGCCAGRVVSALEGGYDLEALGASAAAHVRALMEA